MTKSELYTFVTGLLDGIEMDTTLFDTFLNIAQMYWEGRRPWMILREEDSSQTVSTSNTFTTAKSLPTNFRRFYARYPIVLVDSQGNPQVYASQVGLQSKFTYRSDLGKFYCKYGNSQFFLTGSFSQSLTAYLYYIKKTTLVSADDDNQWDFPSEYHPILGLSVATYYKLGVDYDIVNNAQADNNAALANGIFAQMSDWDDSLQENSVEGEEYGTNGQSYFTGSGGRLRPDIT